MQEGQIEIKEDKEKRFYVDINLTLKEYGKLDLKLMLYDENQLSIKIYSDNQDVSEVSAGHNSGNGVPVRCIKK